MKSSIMHCSKSLLTRLWDIETLSAFTHTGALEVYHSNQLAPKRVHFYYIGMQAHQQLAALNHNHSVGRELARTAIGEKRWNVVFQKAKKQWIAKVSGKINGLL